MLNTFVLVAITLIIGAYGCLHGNLYRKPYLLIMMGMGVGIIGAFLAHSALSMGENPHLSHLAPYSQLASDIITVLVSSLCGGIIVSAMVIRLEQLHREDLRTANRKLQFSEKMRAIVEKNLQEFEKKSGDLSEEECRKEYDRLIRQHIMTTEALMDIQDKIDDLEGK